MALSGDAFHRTIISGTRDVRGQVLAQFKTHVKKDNVDLASVPRYFEALTVTMNLLDPELQTLAFSLVCHLVKRVSIQDKSGLILPGVSSVVLPIIIPKIADARNLIKMSARRALEAYWLSAPEKTERAVVEIGLGDNGLLLANESIVWLNSLLLINTNLDLHPFFLPLSLVLGKYPNDEKLASNIKILFANYFDLKHNRLHRFELQKILESSNVSAGMRTSIIGTDSLLSREYESRGPLSTNSPMSVVSPPPTISLPPPSATSTTTLSSTSSTTVTQINSKEIKSVPKSHLHSTRSISNFDKNEQKGDSQTLEALLQSLTGHALEIGIETSSVDTVEELHVLVNSISPCFEGKENEKNWIQREKAINKMRTLLRGDAYHQFGELFINSIKDMAEAICKGLMSLRTSLCLGACQLVKELAIYLQLDFSTLFDLFWPTLLRLCSSTKHLTSSTANVVVSTMFAYTTLTTKSAQKIYSSAKEKSANLRAYSAFWSQIYMVRSHKLWPVPPSCEMIEAVLLKLLPDPNAQVRLAAKDAFWRYYVLAVDSATVLLSKLDSNTVKALERSRPQSCEPAAFVASHRTSRPSLKEAIVAKNKELQRRVSTSRSNSRSGLRSHLESSSKSTDTSIESATRISSVSSINRKDHDSLESDTKSLELKQVSDTHKKYLVPSSLKLKNGKKPHDQEAKASLSNIGSEHCIDNDLELNPENVSHLLTSKSSQQIQKGLHLLSIMFSRNLDLSSSLKSSISHVLIAHPSMFGSILREANQCEKLAAIAGANELVRTCFIALDSSADCYKILSERLNGERLTEAVNSLLYHICHMDSISDKKQLVMQLIKYKRTILAMLMEVLISILSANSINKALFTTVTHTLMSLVPVVYQTEIINPYKALLKLLHQCDENEFSVQLNQTPLQNQRELRNLIEVEPLPQPHLDDVTSLYPSEFTQIAPGGISSSLSPLKHPSDFTMLLPTKQPISYQLPSLSHLEGVTRIDSSKDHSKEDLVREHDFISPAKPKREPTLSNDDVTYTNDLNRSNPDREEEYNHSSERIEGSTTLPEKELPFHNVFANTDSKALNSEFVARLNHDPAGDLLEDFAQVKLTNFSNTIESFIEKVDPFNKMSGRSKPIAIFEDPKSCSPQKVKEYSYTKMNWFNFLIARLAVGADEHKGETVDEICQGMESGMLGSDQLAKLLKALQSNQDQGTHQMSAESFKRLELSLWKYLEYPDSDRLFGLMIIKQLLVCHHPIKLETLWPALVSISADENLDVEQYVVELALKEVLVEMLCGMYSSLDMFSMVLGTLNEIDLPEPLLCFAAETLLQLLESKALVLLLSRDLILQVDEASRQYMKHDSSRVRKAVFKSFGLFLKASRAISGTGSTENSSAATCMNEVLLELSASDRKLVEYFSTDCI